MDKEDYVLIYEAWGEEEEKVIEGLLRANGIKVFVKSHITPLTHPFTVNGLGSFKIMVKSEDKELAEAILKEKIENKNGGE